MKKLIDIIFKILNYGIIFAGGVNIISSIMYLIGMVKIKDFSIVNGDKSLMNTYQIIALFMGIMYLIMAVYNIKLVHKTKKSKLGIILGIVSLVLIIISNCVVINHWHSIVQIIQGSALLVICIIGSIYYYRNFE